VAARERISLLRTHAGLTQSELARLCAIARAYVGLIESGARVEIGLSKLVSISHVLGCTLDYLVLGRGEAPSPEDVQRAVDAARRDPQRVRDAVDRALGIERRPAPSVRTRRAPRSAARAKHLRRRALPSEARS
jgi:transcriptional regulator with XRE-family HTH domain